MAELNPPLYVQGAGPSAARHRLASIDALLQPGASAVAGQPGVKVGPGTPLAVTAGTGLAVNVAAGTAFVAHGTGLYSCPNDGPVSIALTADAANPRLDLIVARVYDPEAATVPGGVAPNTWRLERVVGAPAATPLVPATPAGAEVLAEVRVNANATTPTTITERRRWTTALGGIGVGAVTGTYAGQYRDSGGTLERWNGSAWEHIGLLAGSPSVAVTVNPGWRSYALDTSPFIGTPKVRKAGGVVTMNGLVENVNAFNPAVGSHYMLTIPAGYRPPGNAILVGKTSSGFFRFDVQPDGQVLLSPDGLTSRAALEYWSLSGSWLL